MADYDVTGAFQDIEMSLIKSMRQTMKRHCNEEYDENINWTQWQAEMLKGLDEYKRNNAAVLPKYMSTINDKITGAIRDANMQGGMEQEIEILRAIRDGYELKDKPTKQSVEGRFFRINEKKLNALIKATTDDMKKAEVATLRMANDVYRKTMFKAQMFYNTGASNMWKAVDMATKDFLNQGINCIQYANGARVNIASYAEMSLRTATKRANLIGEAAKRDAWGIHTVMVSTHGGCCPRCMQWQGQVYIDDVQGSGTAKESRDTGYPLLSKAVAGGLLHPNCKHGVSTYYEGINSKPKAPTKADREESLRKYGLEQQQRYLERNYRSNMRLANGSLDQADADVYRGRALAYKNKLQTLCAKNQDVLRYDKQRMSLRGVLSVDNAGKISIKAPTSSPMQQAMSTAHYDAVRKNVGTCADDALVDVWNLYEDKTRIGSYTHKGGAYAMGDRVYLNLEKVAKGSSIDLPYQVLFHEHGHTIDSNARKLAKTSGIFTTHFSSAYKEGLFPKTIESEVQAWVGVHDKRLKAEFKAHKNDLQWFKDNGYASEWSTTVPKYSKSYAYGAVKKELKAYNKIDVADLCDIVEGATRAKVSCVAGHGKKYWTDRMNSGINDGLAAEAFAEMIDSTMANEGSLKLIKKHLPESYNVFKEMLEVIKNG